MVQLGNTGSVTFTYDDGTPGNFKQAYSSGLNMGKWNHVVIQRNPFKDGGVIEVWINGKQSNHKNITVGTSRLPDASEHEYYFAIGSHAVRENDEQGGIPAAYEGYIQDFRITKNAALYPGIDFNPPTHLLPDPEKSTVVPLTAADNITESNRLTLLYGVSSGGTHLTLRLWDQVILQAPQKLNSFEWVNTSFYMNPIETDDTKDVE